MILNYAVTFYAISKSTPTSIQQLADGNVHEQRLVIRVSDENEPLTVVARPDEVKVIENKIVKMKDGTEYGVIYDEGELERCFAFVKDYSVDIQIGY